MGRTGDRRGRRAAEREFCTVETRLGVVSQSGQVVVDTIDRGNRGRGKGIVFKYQVKPSDVPLQRINLRQIARLGDAVLECGQLVEACRYGHPQVGRDQLGPLGQSRLELGNIRTGGWLNLGGAIDWPERGKIEGPQVRPGPIWQLKGLPKFRLHTGFSAYSEGWALYAEQLGKEVGFYQNPASDYGRLNSELFRAVRLVVDTGIHAQGWTRDQVVDYMRKNDVNEPLIQSETDRYIAWPAQACSYKLGQLKIIELRERAKKELGPKFDIRTFHDEILSGGGLPLDMLDARTTQWIALQKSKPNQIVGVGVPVAR